MIIAEFNTLFKLDIYFFNRDTLGLLVLCLACQISVEIPDVTTLNYFPPERHLFMSMGIQSGEGRRKKLIFCVSFEEVMKLLSVAVVRNGVSLCWALASELFLFIYVLWYV